MTGRPLIVLALSLCLLGAGCGGARDAGEPPPSSSTGPELPRFEPLDDSRSTSARFGGEDRMTFEGVEEVSTVAGAFDWRTNTGWVTTTSDLYTLELIQIGDTCYRREPPGTWQESRAEDVDDLCDAALLSNPATEFQLMSMVRSDDLVVVGEESLEGDPVTHYRTEFTLHDDVSRVEYWVDEEGIVRRSLTVDEAGGFEIARSYSDLGLEVRVEAPTTPEARLADLVG